MISFPRRGAALALPVTAVVVVGVALATTGFAEAVAVSPDLAVGTSVLQFQPPVTLPDAGTATVTVTNVGIAKPAVASIEVDTKSRLKRVTADGLLCRIAHLSSGADVARCAIPPGRIPATRQVITMALTVEIASPPGNCTCVPFTVRLLVTGDSNPVDNVAIAPIVR